MKENLLQKKNLNYHEILKILPQKFPFLLVDSIEDLIFNVQAFGKKRIVKNEPFFDSFYIDELIMPEVLLIESAAQVAMIMVLSDSENIRGQIRSIEKAEFYCSVYPASTLLIYAKVIESNNETILINSMLTVGEREVANIKIKIDIKKC